MVDPPHGDALRRGPTRLPPRADQPRPPRRVRGVAVRQGACARGRRAVPDRGRRDRGGDPRGDEGLGLDLGRVPRALAGRGSVCRRRGRGGRGHRHPLAAVAWSPPGQPPDLGRALAGLCREPPGRRARGRPAARPRRRASSARASSRTRAAPPHGSGPPAPGERLPRCECGRGAAVVARSACRTADRPGRRVGSLRRRPRFARAAGGRGRPRRRLRRARPSRAAGASAHVVGGPRGRGGRDDGSGRRCPRPRLQGPHLLASPPGQRDPQHGWRGHPARRAARLPQRVPASVERDAARACTGPLARRSVSTRPHCCRHTVRSVDSRG